MLYHSILVYSSLVSASQATFSLSLLRFLAYFRVRGGMLWSLQHDMHYQLVDCEHNCFNRAPYHDTIDACWKCLSGGCSRCQLGHCQRLRDTNRLLLGTISKF